VLVACEFSGIVRDAFREKGHEALSCDLLPTERPGPHYHGDVLEILNNGWDMMIAHPPCTYLSNSGVRWLYTQEQRWIHMIEGAVFFRTLWQADIPKICVENPIMHRFATQIIGRRQDQCVQPWQHGHGETKGTCLWLKGLPLLKPTSIVEGRKATVHRMSPSPERQKLRSLTYEGIAKAMADQWG
jgi:hypothetical protein